MQFLLPPSLTRVSLSHSRQLENKEVLQQSRAEDLPWSESMDPKTPTAASTYMNSAPSATPPSYVEAEKERLKLKESLHPPRSSSCSTTSTSNLNPARNFQPSGLGNLPSKWLSLLGLSLSRVASPQEATKEALRDQLKQLETALGVQCSTFSELIEKLPVEPPLSNETNGTVAETSSNLTKDDSSSTRSNNPRKVEGLTKPFSLWELFFRDPSSSPIFRPSLSSLLSHTSTICLVFGILVGVLCCRWTRRDTYYFANGMLEDAISFKNFNGPMELSDGLFRESGGWVDLVLEVVGGSANVVRRVPT